MVEILMMLLSLFQTQRHHPQVASVFAIPGGSGWYTLICVGDVVQALRSQHCQNINTTFSSSGIGSG